MTEQVTIDVPIDRVYTFWREPTNLPRIMRHVRSVTPIAPNRTRWVAEGPLGRSLEWDAEIINDVPNQVIGWRSLAHADVVSAGSVNFDRTTDGQSTRVTVKLQYDPPAGRAGAWAAWLLGSDPAGQIAEDLHRLKTFLEKTSRESKSASASA